MMHKRRRWIVLGIASVLSAVVAMAQVETQDSLGQLSLGSLQSKSRQNSGDLIEASRLSAVPENFAGLKLGPGFLLGVKVHEDPDFNGAYRIDESGEIQISGAGSVHVGGSTASEAAERIRQILVKSELLVDPRVDVSILEYTSSKVTVLGEVVGPGKYPLLAARNLTEVLALAGGTTPFAGNAIVITHGEPGTEPETVNYSRGTNVHDVSQAVVHPGDTVDVKRAGIVYVLGAVNRPGGFVMQDNGALNLLQAISLASGTNPTASTRKVFLLRRNKDGSQIQVEIPLGKIFRGEMANLQLHATDIIYVPTSKVKAGLLNTQSLIGATAAASIYRF